MLFLFVRRRAGAGAFIFDRDGPAPHLPAVVLLAGFVIAGIAALGDYGPFSDLPFQRGIGQSFLNVLTGRPTHYLTEHDIYYGAAFEFPLLLVELGLGLDDSRSQILSRHLLSHLFFLAGGWFCYLLIYRMTDSRLWGILSMLLWLTHPRLYAHSFFNSKDLPFATMFVISLYLVRRMLDRDTLGAFALAGLSVGLLVNLRIMGLLLLAAALALLSLDLARGVPLALGSKAGDCRRRQLRHCLVFLLACGLSYYAMSPYMWSNPLHFLDAYTTISDHPHKGHTVFAGRFLPYDQRPVWLVPGWFAITSPPASLLAGGLGLLALLAVGVRNRHAALGRTDTRFGLLLAAVALGPTLAVIAFKPVYYDDWRHLYFMYGPWCLAAGVGLGWLLGPESRRWLRPALRRGAVALLALGIASAAAQGALIHPNQDVYFNLLVDRTTPDRLGQRYIFGVTGPSWPAALDYAYRHTRCNPLYVAGGGWHVTEGLSVMPLRIRAQLQAAPDHDAADIWIENMHFPRYNRAALPASARVAYARRVYGSVLIQVIDLSGCLQE